MNKITTFKIGDEITILNDNFTINEIIKITSVENKKLDFKIIISRKDRSIRSQDIDPNHDCEIYKYKTILNIKR